MNLKDLDIKPKYDTDVDDIVSDFYEPVLSNSVKYYRLSGFFTSSSLAAIARGIGDFIRNNGKMRLVCSARLSERDIEIIKKTNENPSKILEQSIIQDLDSIENNIIQDHVAALGWMLAKGNLEIKIAILKDEDSDFLPSIPLGMFHTKLGLFEDTQGNTISFSGSENETYNGIINNVENIKTFKSWKGGDSPRYVELDRIDFEKYWNDEAVRTKVISLPNAVKENLLRKAPEKIEQIKIHSLNSKKSDVKLRKYQEKAIEKWFENGKQGIFEMATGTGKTYTALGCLHRIKKEINELLTVIVAPQKHLVTQWEEEVEKCGYHTIFPAYSGTKWKNNIISNLLDLEMGIIDSLVILTTHKTFSSEDFRNRITTFKGELFLIIDEVHGIGSDQQRLGLIDNYKYRLGLSATPERWYDEEGTELIESYFKGVVFSFNIERALRCGYLTPYEYHPVFVDLSESEMVEYLKYTSKINRLFHSKEKTSSTHDNINRLLIKRQNIINEASEKYLALNQILDENNTIKNLLVYCNSEKQLTEVSKIFNKRRLFQSRFTGSEKLSERGEILKKFIEGRFRALIAMKCLDEGVDIPSAEIGILMSSTSNPREYIQRRGRLLRKSPGKKLAVIYDILVFPEIKYNNSLEDNIIDKEKLRYREFARTAKNSAECTRILAEKLGVYDE
jgi:superfamily II DNA or RNA helicase